MTDVDDLQFGAIIPKGPRPAPEFRSIISDLVRENSIAIATKELQSEVKAAEGSLPMPTPIQLREPLIPSDSADYLAPFESWKMLGNDRYRDCAAAAWANMRRLVTSKLTGHEKYPTMDNVMDIYRTQNKTLNPEGGMVSEDLFDHLLQNGGPDGVCAVGYAKVNWKDFLEVKQALAIFGAIWLEIEVFKSNLEQFDYKIAWQAPAKPDPDYMYQHIVLAGGYTADGGLKIVTWGQTAYLSQKFIENHVVGAWLVVWPEHFGSRRFTRTIDMERFSHEFNNIKGKTIAPPDPIVNNIVATYHVESKPKQSATKYFNIVKIQPTSKVESIDEKDLADESDPKNPQRVWNYAVEPVRSVTPIEIAAVATSILVIDNDDLYLIKTKQTLSNRIETQRILGPRYYDLESNASTVTAFKIRSNDDGIYCIDNGDLYCIKKPRADLDRTYFEVHWAPGEKRFQSVQKFGTTLTLPPGFRLATISGGDLYVFADNAETGKLRVYCSRGNALYSEASVSTCDTAFQVTDLTRNFSVGLRGDIYMVKDTGGDDPNNVEIWFASAKRWYQSIVKYPTKIEQKAVNKTTLWLI